MFRVGGRGVGLAPSQGFAIFCLYYSYRKLLGVSWNFFGILPEFLAGRTGHPGRYILRIGTKISEG